MVAVGSGANVGCRVGSVVGAGGGGLVVAAGGTGVGRGVGAVVAAAWGVAVAAGSVGLGVSGTGTDVAVGAAVAVDADAAVGATVGGNGVGSCPQAMMPRTAKAAPQIINDIKRRTTTNFSNLLGFLNLIPILTQHLAAASSREAGPMG